MKFKDYLLEQENVSSAAVIKDAFHNTGYGMDLIRQTQTKDNTSSSVYKENGHSVDAFWIMEDGPMSEEGYSDIDAKQKLKTLIDEFKKLGGNIDKIGNIDSLSTIISFEDFKISLIPLMLNSAIDNSGFNRTYLKVEVS